MNSRDGSVSQTGNNAWYCFLFFVLGVFEISNGLKFSMKGGYYLDFLLFYF